ncbi:MAG: ParA family protein, partial [Chloroflexota bacterium]
SRTRLSRMFLQQFREKFSPRLMNSVIPLDNRLRESALFNRPIVQYASKSRSADEYRLLAKELLVCQQVPL